MSIQFWQFRYSYAGPEPVNDFETLPIAIY